MSGLVRLLQIACIALLAMLAISFAQGLFSPSTGVVEKAVLLLLVGGCLYLATKVTTLATRMLARLQRD